MKNPKIDIYVRGTYAHSTTQSKTCKEAKQRYFDYHYPAILFWDIKCARAK